MADTSSILSWWEQFFSNLLYVNKRTNHDDGNKPRRRWEHFISELLNFNQTTSHEERKIYTAEPDIPEPSLLEVELTIENLRKHKTPGVDHIPSKLILADGVKLYEVGELRKI